MSERGREIERESKRGREIEYVLDREIGEGRGR